MIHLGAIRTPCQLVPGRIAFAFGTKRTKDTNPRLIPSVRCRRRTNVQWGTVRMMGFRTRRTRQMVVFGANHGRTVHARRGRTKRQWVGPFGVGGQREHHHGWGWDRVVMVPCRRGRCSGLLVQIVRRGVGRLVRLMGGRGQRRG